jgi:hypothetical protein
MGGRRGGTYSAPEKQHPVDAAVEEGVTLDGRGTEPACRFLGAIDPGQRRSPLERAWHHTTARR